MHASSISGVGPHALGLDEEAVMSASGSLLHPTHHYTMHQYHSAYGHTEGVLPWMKAKAKTSLGSIGMAAYYKHQEDKRLARLRGVKSVIVAKHYNKLHPAAAKCLPELEPRPPRRPPCVPSMAMDGPAALHAMTMTDALPPGGKALYSAEDFWKDVAPPPHVVHGQGVGGHHASSLDLMEIEDAKAKRRRHSSKPLLPHTTTTTIKARKANKRGRRRSDGDAPIQPLTQPPPYLGPPLGLGRVGTMAMAGYEDMERLGQGLSMQDILPLQHPNIHPHPTQDSPRGECDGDGNGPMFSPPPTQALGSEEASGPSASVGLGVESSVLLMSEGLMSVQQAMATLRDMASPPPPLNLTDTHDHYEDLYHDCDDYLEEEEVGEGGGPIKVKGEGSPPRRRRRKRRASDSDSTRVQGLKLPAVALTATLSSTLHSQHSQGSRGKGKGKGREQSSLTCPRCHSQAHQGLASTVSCLLPPKAFAKQQQRRASMPNPTPNSKSKDSKPPKPKAPKKKSKDEAQQGGESSDPQLASLLTQLSRLPPSDRLTLLAALRHSHSDKPLHANGNGNGHNDGSSSHVVEEEDEAAGTQKEAQAQAQAQGATVRGRLYMGRRSEPSPNTSTKPHSLSPHPSAHATKALSPHRHPTATTITTSTSHRLKAKPAATPKAHKHHHHQHEHEQDSSEAHHSEDDYEDDFHEHEEQDDKHHPHNKNPRKTAANTH